MWKEGSRAWRGEEASGQLINSHESKDLYVGVHIQEDVLR